MSKYDPNIPPYPVDKGDPLCQTCRHGDNGSVDCPERNDKEHDCLWHDTLKEKALREKKISDLVVSSTTPERARTLIDLINVIPLREGIDTSNHSKTQHYLGERNMIMSELKKLKELLNIEHCTDLIVLLTNISKGESK